MTDDELKKSAARALGRSPLPWVSDEEGGPVQHDYSLDWSIAGDLLELCASRRIWVDIDSGNQRVSWTSPGEQGGATMTRAGITARNVIEACVAALSDQ